MSGLDGAAVARLADALARAGSALFITGAGVSADSGLPTYRGVGGLYEDAHTDDGIPIEMALSGPMFRRRPELVWKHMLALERACRGARPNRAHEVIAALEARVPRLWVVTQNVDGFHGDAGSRNVIELHGTTRAIRCAGCRERRPVAVGQLAADGIELPPRCRACGGVERPDVVLFGEPLPAAACALLEQELRRGFEVVVSVGTSSAFPYVVEPLLDAREAGALTVEINPNETEASELVDLRLRAGAAVALDAVWQALPACRAQ